MTIDFMTIGIVLINEQAFVWPFTTSQDFRFLELLDRFQDLIVWSLLIGDLFTMQASMKPSQEVGLLS